MEKKDKNIIYILCGILIIVIFCIVFMVVNYNFRNYFSEEDKKEKEFAKVESYVKSHEINVVTSNENIIENVKLPKDFKYTNKNINVGEILKEKNEFSKRTGYNFEDDLGKKVDIIYYKLEGRKHYLIAFLDDKSIVGLWIDKAENNENKIETEEFLNVMKTMAT